MPRQSKILHKRTGSPYWQYRFTIDGQEFRGSTGIEEQVRAQEFATRMMNQCYDQIRLKRKSKINLSVALIKYFEEYAQFLKSGHISIKFQLNNLRKFFGDGVMLDQVDDALLNQYVVHRRNQYVMGKDEDKKPIPIRPISPSTINRELSAFRKMYHLARDVWKVEVGDCNISSHYLSEPDQHAEHLSEEEQAALVQNVPLYLKNPIRFALITGVRRANIIGLKWEDIRNGYITFRVKSQMPEGKIHTLPVTDEVQYILDAEAKKNEKLTGYVFRNPEGGQLGDFRKSLYTAFKKAGIERKEGHGFHLLRHSSATSKLKNGVKIEVVQKLLGHHSITTTMRYAHVMTVDIADAMKKQNTQNARILDDSEDEKQPKLL